MCYGRSLSVRLAYLFDTLVTGESRVVIGVPLSYPSEIEFLPKRDETPSNYTLALSL